MLTLGATLGCSDNPNTITLEVYSWWDDTAERAAFEAVAAMHHDSYENVEVINLRNSSNDARTELSRRMLADAPPATFQANVGADLLRWALVDTQADENSDVRDPPLELGSRIGDLSDVYAAELGGSVPDEIDSMLRLGAGTAPYAIPINIHRLNVLYYNRQKVAQYSDPDGRELLDIDTLCPENPDQPELVGVTISVSLADPWTLILFVFENLLPALIEREREANPDFDPDADFYARLFRGEEPEPRLAGGESVLVKKALDCAKYLSQSFDDAGTWASAVREVGESATFTVMGDWANALLAGDLREGGPIGMMPFPGTGNLYVYTSDTFPLPLGVDYPDEALDLLRTFASRDAQDEFSRLKGSIPARMDFDFDSPPGWSTTDEFRDPDVKKLLATSGYFPVYYPQAALWTRLSNMVSDTAGEAAVNAALREFTDAEKLLGRWQQRLGQGAARTTTTTTTPPP